MKSCVVCNKSEKLFVFPKDERLLVRWIKVLRLNRRPTSSDMICRNHFQPCDIMLTPKGYHKLKPGAVPSVNIHVNYNVRDHNYSASHKDEFGESLCFLITLAPLILCLLPLLLLFFSSLSDLNHRSFAGNNLLCPSVFS
jgi:hypothetical protein